MSCWKTAALSAACCLAADWNANGQAPGCPNVTAGPDVTLPCGTTCTDLTATLLETGETSSYSVMSIPYTPPFSFTGGASIFIGIDDQWSGVVNLPFDFCFYGNSYNQMIIGANGLISFDLSLANSWCEWSFSASIPTPGPPPTGIYNNTINGAFHDIDPSVTWTGAGNDINYAVLGSPPCRTLVVNFFDVPHYSCNNLTTTQQIVLYETTNVVEVYINDKPTCFSWNSGNAVIGLQNATGSAGVTPPGRNTGNWTASNEAWRFTPNGPPNYQVDWYDINNAPIGSGNPVNVCPVANTTYIAKATYTNCNGATVIETDTTVVTLSGPYIASVTNPSCNIGCNGSATVGINNGVPPFTYIWSPSGGSGSTGTGLCAGANYTVTIIDATSNTCTIPFFFNTQNVLADITAYANPSCAGVADGSATATAIGGTAPYTYAWSPSGGNGSAAAGLSAGTLYTITITDSAGCVSSDSITLTEPMPLTAAITSTTNPTCDTSADGTALVSVSGGTGTYTISWTPGGSTTAFASGLSGGVPYTVNVSDSNGCVASDVVTLISPQPVTAVISAFTNPSCTNGTDGSAAGLAGGGTGTYTYAWSPSGGSGSSASNLSGGVQYTVSVADANGCAASANITLTDPPLLVALITDSVNPSCGGSSDGSATVTATGGTGTYTYAWSPSGGGGAVETGLSGWILYAVVVTDANGCTSADAVTLVSPPPLITAITNSTPPSCFNTNDAGATTSTTGGLGSYTFLWSPSGGNDSAGVNLSGGILYTVQVTDSMGCISSDTITIVAPLAMTADIVSTTDPACDTSGDGSATVLVANGVGPYQYAWSPAGGTGPTATGLYGGTVYTMNATDANGCSLATQVTLNAPPTLTASISGPDSICEGGAANLVTTVAGGTPGYSYAWSPSGTPTDSNTYMPLATTTYNVTVTDVNGCPFYLVHDLIVNPLPAIDFTADVVDGCQPLTVQFSNTSPAYVYSSLDLGNGTGNDNTPFYQVYDNVGTYDVSLTITDKKGCINTLAKPAYISVYPHPVADFTAKPWEGTVVIPTINFYDETTGSSCWNWFFDTLGQDSIANPEFTFPDQDTGTYPVLLVVCNQYGCTDSIVKNVRIRGDYVMFVPNTFTPNKSGVNDNFIPVGFGLDYSRLQFWIFNRWGEEIYFTDNGVPWDGKDMSGSGEQQMDVYVWMAVYRDDYQKLHQALGHVTVLR